MHTIQFFSTGFAYPGERSLFYDLNISLHQGVYALAGQNGSGKSTLLKIIAGELEPTTGCVRVGDGATVRYLAPSAIDAEMRIGTLSAGESKMRQLATLFGLRRDILLLDEPEVHLDQHNRAWLMRQLRQHAGTVLVVSHDETLLDSAEHVLHLENGRITLFSMRYRAYRAEILFRRHRQEIAVERKLHSIALNQRRRQTDLERQIRRANNAARRAPLAGIPRVARGLMKRNAEKTLGKIVSRSREEAKTAAGELAALREQKGRTPQWHLSEKASRRAEPARFEAVALQVYRRDAHPLWDRPLNFSVAAGERLHLQGRNGSGKSQLLAALAGRCALPWTGQFFLRGGKARLIDPAFSQVEPVSTLLALARQFLREEDDGRIRRVLGAFGYRADRVFLSFAELSTGEKMRFYLMLLNHSPEAVVVVLFDEAEAGLDTESKQLVVDYLLTFQGVVIFASHDPGFAAALQPQHTLNLTVA